MSKNRRRYWIRVVELTAVSVIILDAVVYLAVVRPLWKQVAANQRDRELVERRMVDERLQIARMRKTQSEMPATSKEIQAFFREHVPSRRHGFSSAERLIRKLSDESDLQLSEVSYHLDSSENEPLERLGLNITVQGAFPDLIRFVHALETNEVLVLVHNFAFQPVEKGTLALRLVADLYLTP